MALNEQVKEVFDWLLDGAPGAPTPMAVIKHLGEAMNEGAVPVDRITAFVRTLHPHVAGRRFEWTPGHETQVAEASWSFLNAPDFVDSPVGRVFATGQPSRSRLDGAEAPATPELAALEAQGFTEEAVYPLVFMGGSVHAVTFGTKAKGGFTDAHHEALAHVVRPLSRVGETLALMRTAANLLNTYVGRDAGDRILKGHIQRGDTEIIECVIWFSDLRGFTSLSGERTPKQIISVLNEFFDCQVPAIEAQRGEVLKFMGDGLLAIFPLGEGHSLTATAQRALTASRGAREALAALNTRRGARGEGPLAFGIALHVGEVAYGNIGGAGRLDFTCIGPAVNLASRLEGLTGKVGKPVLLSEPLAQALVGCAQVGAYELKGVDGAQRVYEPPASR